MPRRRHRPRPRAPRIPGAGRIVPIRALATRGNVGGGTDHPSGRRHLIGEQLSAGNTVRMTTPAPCGGGLRLSGCLLERLQVWRSTTTGGGPHPPVRLAARGQSPSMAFGHSKSCAFHGSCTPGTSSLRCGRLCVHSLRGRRPKRSDTGRKSWMTFLFPMSLIIHPESTARTRDGHKTTIGSPTPFLSCAERRRRTPIAARRAGPDIDGSLGRPRISRAR